jgi:hypothetical protein
MRLTNDGVLMVKDTIPYGTSNVRNFNDVLYIQGSNKSIGINTSNPAVSLDISATDAIQLPAGTTVQRPINPRHGNIRYNTTSGIFEGFSAGNIWGSLGGVRDTNQDTYISAESFPTSNDDTIRFVNSNKETMRITKTGFVGIGTSNPLEVLDITGNVDVSSNMYVMNRIAIGHSNPTESIDIIGNTKVSSNMYAMQRLGIATSNPTESMDIASGNLKVAQSIFTMSNLAVGISNPTVAFEVAGSAIIRSNLEVRGDLTIQGTTTTINATTVNITDNIIRLNNAAAYTSGLRGGFEINRGPGYSNYMMVYDEAQNNLLIGRDPNLLPVAARDASPIANSVAVYDSSANKYTGCNSLIFQNNALQTTGSYVCTNQNRNVITTTNIISFSHNVGGNAMIGMAYARSDFSIAATNSNDLVLGASQGRLLISTSNVLITSNVSICGSTILHDNSTTGSSRFIIAKQTASDTSSMVFTTGGTTIAQGVAEIGTTGDNSLALKVNSSPGVYTTRMYISPTSMGIGTASPQGTLHLVNQNASSANNPIIIEAASLSDGTMQGLSAINFNGYTNSTRTRVNTGKNHWRMLVNQNAANDIFQVDSWNGTSNIVPFSITSTGNVGVRTANPSYALEVLGQIYASDNVWAFSDGRYKTDLRRIEDALNIVEKLNGYIYRWQGTGARSVGVVAQEVAKHIPELVTYDETKDRYGVNYGSMTALLLEAIKELSATVKDIKADVSELKHQISAMI